MTKATPIKLGRSRSNKTNATTLATGPTATAGIGSGSGSGLGVGTSTGVGTTTGRGSLRGKGTYASRACNVCKRKKVKCDEIKPVCGTCEASGRSEECAWTGESARKPRTEAHFEAMRKRAEALERYANILESMLERCRKEHGGTFSKDGHEYLQFRPKEYGYYGSGDVEGFEEGEEVGIGTDGEDDATAEICVSTENLTLDERGLVLYGIAAPFRFANTNKFDHVSIIPDVELDLGARYMLMVEGADLAHYNPDFDWSRYLPPQVPLDRKEHDRVLDLLFKFFTSWCMRIVPVLFLRDMYRYLNIPRTQTPPKTSHYSPMLHNALLALATGFSDNPAIRDYRARKYFADEAKRLMESEVQRPNVSVIHALSILGSFHSSNGEQGLGYVYFGIGIRVSQALGLSVDCSAWVKSGRITTHDMYDRNLTYWMMHTQSACWDIYVGRDFNVLNSSEGSSIPVPYVDAAYDQLPWSHPSAERYIAPQPSYLSTTFAATCELMNIAGRVMGVINSLHISSNRREVKDEQISSIDLQLHAWKGALPTELDITLANKNTSTPHKLVLHLAFWWMFILLHRPFFHRKRRTTQDASSREIDHVKICKRAADSIMDLLGIYRSLYTLRYVPVTPVQIAFAAGTVYILLAVQATTGLRVAKKELETYVAQAELCIQYLTEIGKSWKCSEEIADILRGLVRTQLRPVLERRAIKDREREKDKGKEREKDEEVRAHAGTAPSATGRTTNAIGPGQWSPSTTESPEVVDKFNFTPSSSGSGSLSPPKIFGSSPSQSIDPAYSTFFSNATLSSASAPNSHLRTSYATTPSSSSLLADTFASSTGLPTPHNDFFNDMLFETDLSPSSPHAGISQSTGSFILQGLPGFGNTSPDAPDTHTHTHTHRHPNTPSDPFSGIFSMETAGFLAMLGGETMGHAPCIPPFSSSPSIGHADYADDPMASLEKYFSIPTGTGTGAGDGVDPSSMMQTDSGRGF
ncbi:hypothetical protein GYMLUDRAFT_237288 [Collybiopsis luxurians FD-317 M1]|nr:hypothetical protein GYMLUDRAFT_237288 [Collybiopsis luxurians FD-317 M1]